MPQNNIGQGVRISHRVSSLFFAWLGGETTRTHDMQQRAFAMSRSVRLIGAVAVLALLPTASQALGVADLKLQSALSEPFRAEIELTSVNPKDLKTLKATLVTGPDFAVGGIPPGAPITGQLAVRVSSEADGRHLLKLYSDQPIREPYVRFLLKLDWAGGRLTREFTTLLDPREGAPESDAVALEAQPPPNSDTQVTATAEAPVAAASVAPEPTPPAPTPKAPAEAVPPADTGAAKQLPVGPKADGTVEVKTQAPASTQSELQPPKSGLTTPVPASADERLRLASEIKTWAQHRVRSQPDAEASDAEADGIQTSARARSSPLATAEMRRKIAERTRASASGSAERPTTFLGWIGDHTRELLMAFVALLALSLVGAGSAWFMLTWRRQPTPGINPHPASQAGTELVEQRQRGGRRRQFIPVAIERRRGPRRQADLPQPQLTPIDASETTGDSYPDDSVERALKDEISKYPTRHGLKLKLLALYHARNDRAAFETLLNSIYAAVESDSAADEENWPRFEDYDDLAASDGAAPTMTSVNAPNPDNAVADGAQQNADKQSSPIRDDDAPVAKEKGVPVPTLSELDVPEYPLLMDEHATEIDEELLDLRTAFAEYEPAVMENLTAGPMDEADRRDTGLEALHADDLADIQAIVEHGMDAIEGKNGSEQNESSKGSRTPKKATKRKRKTKSSARSKKVVADGAARERQWRDPAIKIDLAKAYIDMGDPERARHILDEVLAHWHRGDGTDR
jgi:Tfp pilus assembly protein FimV